MPAKAGIQYAAVYRECTDYWIPACAGMTSETGNKFEVNFTSPAFA